MTAPRKAPRAFLRGVHRLDEEGACRASRTGAAVAGAVVFAAGLLGSLALAATLQNIAPSSNESVHWRASP